MPDKREQSRRDRSGLGRNSFTSRETQVNPGVILEFIGYFHLPLNLQVVPLIAEDIRSLVEQTRGETLIYLEYAGLPQRISSATGRMIAKRGLQETRMGMELAKTLGRPPTDGEIHQQKEIIRGNNLAMVTRTYPGSVQKFFLDGEIDQIRRGRKVHVEFEGHSDADAAKIDSIINELYSIDDSMKWGKEPLEVSMAKTGKVIELDLEQSLLRESSVAEYLAKKALSFRKHGGCIILLWGINHAGMAETIKRKADPAIAYVKDQVLLHGPQNDYDFQAIQLVRNGEQLPDEMLARAFFGNQCFNAVSELFHHGAGRLEDFANNFDTIRAAVWGVVEDLSFEDIRRLNDTKEPILKVFFSHPKARVVLPFLH